MIGSPSPTQPAPGSASCMLPCLHVLPDPVAIAPPLSPRDALRSQSYGEKNGSTWFNRATVSVSFSTSCSLCEDFHPAMFPMKPCQLLADDTIHRRPPGIFEHTSSIQRGVIVLKQEIAPTNMSLSNIYLSRAQNFHQPVHQRTACTEISNLNIPKP